MQDGTPGVHEATLLKLDCSKAHSLLGWRPVWTLPDTLDRIVAWHHAYQAGDSMHAVTVSQIVEYQGAL
jgi:CDP-glucose 4,6-dehydratase